MSSVRRLHRALRRYGSWGVLARVPEKLGAIGRGIVLRRLDRLRTTYSEPHAESPREILPIGLLWMDQSQQHTVGQLAELYHAHRFDVLGSGWLRCGYQDSSPGFEGYVYHMEADLINGWPRGADWSAATRRDAERIRQLVPPGYRPIDWHRDHKSGYRWPTGLHVTRSASAPVPGADVKMPWELARMQHLPILAHAYALDAANGVEGSERHLREIEAEIVDFIASNPPRYGINWQCTMDVGIRVANWVLTFELLRVWGANLREEFKNLLVKSVRDHARHIMDYLEYTPTYRDNHYLANVGGLLFAAAFLPADTESDSWLAFAIQELVLEVESQFHSDGSGTEGSVPYHALSLDITLWTAWLVEILGTDHEVSLARFSKSVSSIRRSRPLASLGINLASAQRLPDATWDRLTQAVQFLINVTRPDGTLPQIGDDDSGRFVRLTPRVRTMTPQHAREEYAQLSVAGVDQLEVYLDDQPLDRRPLTVFGAVLTRRVAEPSAEWSGWSEARLARLVKLPRPARASSQVKWDRPGDLREWEARLRDELGPPHVTRFDLRTDEAAHDTVEFIPYPGMGIYIWRSAGLFLLVRCGEVGQSGRGGHAHNDQLGIELLVNGLEQIADRGTYVYTSSPAHRNEFRSARSHFVPALADGEQNLWPADSRDLFRLIDPCPGTCMYVGPDGFAGSFVARGESVARIVHRQDDAIVVLDFTSHAIAIPGPRTRGYGRLSSSPVRRPHD